MTEYSKLNIIYKLQKWMDSVPGQTFLNYAYSWGASIVILGTLFKLTHLPGANFFLYLGMGTEVLVFFLSAFDRPFDKTADGMELDIHAGLGGDSAVIANGEPVVHGTVGGGTVGGGVISGGVIGGGVVSGGGAPSGGAPSGGGGTVIINGGGVIGGGSVSGGTKGDNVVAAQVGTQGGTPLGGQPSGAVAFSTGAPAGVAEATGNYIDELNELTEVLKKVSEQSKRLTADSEEMENLNRTLTGISRVYEMQLKSASSQMGTIDEINEQTRHMAQQIAELNAIYARMIEAMSVQNVNRQ
ncbi:MAG: gliding motility protein GldL [Prevotella sp.]|nr:gliding motility protein GldL [Prevotella sp.]